MSFYYAPVGTRLTSKLYDSWGAPRVGHTHKGIDLMCNDHAPAVAVISGVCSRTDGGIGGHTVTLHGVDGCLYYYAHLYDGGRAASGAVVTGGTIIGYCDTSGNADKGPTHLHFGMRPGGGININPYPFCLKVYQSDHLTPISGIDISSLPSGALDGIGVGVEGSTPLIGFSDAENQGGAFFKRAGMVILGFGLVILAVIAIVKPDIVSKAVRGAKVAAAL
jgi:hypothetical protein